MISLFVIKSYIEDIFKTSWFAVREIDDAERWTIDDLT